MASFEEEIVVLLETLERAGGTAYADAPYPSPVDDTVEKLSARFAAGDPVEREQISRNVLTCGPLLTAFVQRTASAVAVTKDGKKVAHAFNGLVMAEGVMEAPVRRSLVGLLGKAAEKAGLGVELLADLFRKAPGFDATSVAKDLIGRPWTSPWSELGFRESSSQDGFRYRRWWLRSSLWGWDERLRQVVASVFDRTTGYGLWHLPCQVDEILTEVVEIAQALSPFERPAVQKIFSRDRALLRAFAARMASLAVREASEERLRAGLSALVIENFADDARETLMELSILFDAARRIGVSPEAVFSQAIQWASLQAAEQLRTYLARDPGLQRIESMGYSASSDRDGFRYRHQWTGAQVGQHLCPYQIR